MMLDSLIGTWRAITFTSWNDDGIASEPVGAEPMGYVLFDATGRVFVQMGRNPSDGGSPEEIAKSLMCYFGSFVVTGKIVTVTVESSNMADYVGSVQSRNFQIDGDLMTIGTPGKYQARLKRVR